ncbi:ubiquitin carboxyl-terminal hydrolase 6 [Coprinopsis cinerea okayama7|uniref:Ubiquitin carboxyl-terminal hydrolase n=1 Tax=Coprinopsis cinerea (strain Okayama-7 / 130 / ATCC MYA-4618 / FGSC 9003) TaxID=240176 RepID=D6RQ49_COPC7|nr:ubiquitin carboxyl-terminal hydrolase 6 [Coprinopsis cinerea okayama7\|eukprot:XP_002910365.1 ubiquitin carboxyl-terminal hydrolase 6 [Coprinopsis cinerea okayama7\
MAPLAVHIKHAGKTHDVQLDPDLPPAAFKEAIYQVTGVPVDRMKVMVKGGVLKGQTFMVIGAAGELPKPPEKPIVFLEDMDDSELAEALAKPVGLKNLGNTCYMNATVQALRAIPELQTALSAPALQSTTPLPGSLRDLYHNMSRTTDSMVPAGFLQTLRQVNPQFAEMDRSEKRSGMPGMPMGYAQQDAEECYAAIVNSLRNVPGLTEDGVVASTSAQATTGSRRFVEQYLLGVMTREMTCDEAPEEPKTVQEESVLKVECNISVSTNFMLQGILSSLDQKIEKNSPSLGRQAVYTQKSRLSRLPTYLTVHMVRFAWRADIGKKAKIMRRVKFPLEFDATDLATDELKAKLLPASRKLKEIERERAERLKVRKKTKVATGPAQPAAAESSSSGATGGGDVEMSDAAADTSAAGGELQPEHVYREKEAKELNELIHADLKSDVGSSATGLYDLVAIITHKGAAADAGHYIGFVKKSVFHPIKGQSAPPPAVPGQAEAAGSSSTTGTPKAIAEIEPDDEDWYKFDDDKVSIFPKEKIPTLEGGGEDSSAYVLLYKSKGV